MNIDDLTIGQARQLAAMFPVANVSAELKTFESPQSPFIGKHVIVRTYSAGVHVGILTAKDGQNVILANAKRIWKWEGAFTLSEAATAGIKISGSRVSAEVSAIELTQAVEIIPTTEAARAAIEACNA